MDIAESIIIFVLCFVIVVIPTAFLFIETFKVLPSPQGRLVDKYDRLLSYLIVNQYDNSKET